MEQTGTDNETHRAIRCLLVEDEALIAMMVASELKNECHAVVHTS